MDNASLTKEYGEFLCHRLSEILPEYFRLHSKLLEVAGPATHGIRCSLNDLSKTLNYDRHVLYYFLTGLAALKFITLPRLHDFNSKVRIQIVVRY